MRAYLCLFVYAISTAAAAQNCESVVALSKVVRTTTSDSETVVNHANKFCSAYSKKNSDSNSAEFGASYKFLALSMNNASASVEEVASKYCSSANSYQASKDAYRNYIESISPNAYGAYEQCLRISKQDLKINVEANSITPTQFAMSTSFQSSINSAKDATLDYTASDGITCKWNDGGAKVKRMATGSSAILQCSRSDQSKRGSVTVVRTDASNEPMTIPWQAYSTDGTPVDSIGELQRSINALQGKLDANQAVVAELRRSVNSINIACYSDSASASSVDSAAEIRIPEAKRATHQVTGGSCTTGLGTNGHNAILVESRKTDDGFGWRCKSSNQMNLPTNVTTTVSVIYCRASAS